MMERTTSCNVEAPEHIEQEAMVNSLLSEGERTVAPVLEVCTSAVALALLPFACYVPDEGCAYAQCRQTLS